jgi:hypothetical protein
VLVAASNEIGTEVNIQKSNNVDISQHQHAAQTHSTEMGNKSFEKVEHFRYLETTQFSIHEEIKGPFKSRNACYRLVQNILSSSLLPKNIKISISRTVILQFCISVKLGLS